MCFAKKKHSANAQLVRHIPRTSMHKKISSTCASYAPDTNEHHHESSFDSQGLAAPNYAFYTEEGQFFFVSRILFQKTPDRTPLLDRETCRAGTSAAIPTPSPAIMSKSQTCPGCKIPQVGLFLDILSVQYFNLSVPTSKVAPDPTGYPKRWSNQSRKPSLTVS